MTDNHLNAPAPVYATQSISLSGNGRLNDTLIVNMLNLSGNVSLTQVAAGYDGASDAGGVADTLLAGDLNVYISDSGNNRVIKVALAGGATITLAQLP